MTKDPGPGILVGAIVFFVCLFTECPEGTVFGRLRGPW